MARPQRPSGRILLVGLIVIALLVGGGIAYSVLGTSSGHASPPSASAAQSTVISPSPGATIVGSGSMLAMAFSGDRRTLADRLSDGTVQLRDATTGSVLGVLKTGPAVNEYAPMAFSPDGKVLAVGIVPASGNATDAVQLWNVAARKLTTTVPVNGFLHALAYSPDGSTIAAAAGQDFVLVNTKTFSPLYIPASESSSTEFQGNALMLAYSGDGKTLAVANNEGLIQLWNVREAKFAKSITMRAPVRAGYIEDDDEASVEAIALNRNGTSVAAVGSFDYRRFISNGTQTADFPGGWLADTKTGRQQVITPEYPVNAEAQAASDPDTPAGQGAEEVVAFSPSADLFATGDDQGDWQLWNGATGRSVETRYSQSDQAFGTIAFSADGRTLATSQDTYGSGTSTGQQAAVADTSMIELWHVYQQPDTSTTCAAHGSGAANPVLAYTDSTTVELRCGSGSPTVLGTRLPNPSDATGYQNLAWSWDGKQLAWLSSARVSVADVATGAVRTWACLACTGLAFLGDRAVTVTQQAAGGELTAAKTQLAEYPASGFADPGTLAVTGIPVNAKEDLDTDFLLLSAVSSGSVAVAYGSAGGSDLGGDQLLYRVGENGAAAEYGDATLDPPSNGPNTVFGALGQAAAPTVGGGLGLVEYTRGGACGGSTAAIIVNTATGTVSTPKVPAAGGGLGGFWVEGLWYDTAGTPYVSLVPNGSDCSGDAPGGGAEPIFPVSANPLVCKLVGGAWTVVGDGTFLASYGPGGWLAAQDGTISDSVEQTTVKVTHGGTSYSLPGVKSFAWAPAR